MVVAKQQALSCNADKTFANKVAGKKAESASAPHFDGVDGGDTATIKAADVEQGGTDEDNLERGGFRPSPDVIKHQHSLGPCFYISRWRFVPSAVLAYLIFVAALTFYVVVRV